MSARGFITRYAPRLLLLVLFIGGAWFGWHWWASHWRPDAAIWPKQGVAVGTANEPISWP